MQSIGASMHATDDRYVDRMRGILRVQTARQLRATARMVQAYLDKKRASRERNAAAILLPLSRVGPGASTRGVGSRQQF